MAFDFGLIVLFCLLFTFSYKYHNLPRCWSHDLVLLSLIVILNGYIIVRYLFVHPSTFIDKHAAELETEFNKYISGSPDKLFGNRRYTGTMINSPPKYEV